MSVQRKSESTLVPKAHLQFKSLTIRVPSDILDRMERVKDDASALGYVFDAQTVLTSAIVQALKRAESELKKLLTQSN